MIPRTEWVEWWRISAPVGEDFPSQYAQRIAPSPVPEDEDGEGEEGANEDVEDDGVVPLIRRGCSWACVPEMGGKEVRGWLAPTTTTKSSVEEIEE